MSLLVRYLLLKLQVESSWTARKVEHYSWQTGQFFVCPFRSPKKNDLGL